jgi:hypothetical protein
MTRTATLTTTDIAPAFIVIGALSLLGLLFFARLPYHAAAEVSGHRGTNRPRNS